MNRFFICNGIVACLTIERHETISLYIHNLFINTVINIMMINVFNSFFPFEIYLDFKFNMLQIIFCKICITFCLSIEFDKFEEKKNNSNT